MQAIPPELRAYYEAGKPLVCDLADNPFACEFWPESELSHYNEEYEVPRNAPGYFGFGTSGGGEVIAISPTGEIVCLPFIGMNPSEAMLIAPSWQAFECMLQEGA